MTAHGIRPNAAIAGAARLHWVVAGGGTGGHVTPALALAERIAARGDEPLLLGSERGLEARLVPEAGFRLISLPSRQVMGQSALSRLASIPDMLRACFAAWRELGRFDADIVVSVGGYASIPAVLAAVLRRLPLALVEPNAVPGRANRLAARFARRIFVQFDAAGRALAGADDERVCGSGIPLRADLVAAFAGASPRRARLADLEGRTSPLRLLVFGGSQGARQINDAMLDAAAKLDPATLEIFHQTGEADRERVANAYSQASVRAEVVAFERDMPRRYAWADLALCRAGALTVAELALAGLPALLVPYPFAADDHQTANARALEEVGAARVLAGQRGDPTALAAQLARELESLLAAPESLRAMSAAASKLARPDAAERVVEACLALCTERPARTIVRRED